MTCPTSIRDPAIPLTLGAFRALQDEVRRLDAALKTTKDTLSAIATSYPTTDEGGALAGMAADALKQVAL